MQPVENTIRRHWIFVIHVRLDAEKCDYRYSAREYFKFTDYPAKWFHDETGRWLNIARGEDRKPRNYSNSIINPVVEVMRFKQTFVSLFLLCANVINANRRRRVAVVVTSLIYHLYYSSYLRPLNIIIYWWTLSRLFRRVLFIIEVHNIKCLIWNWIPVK